MSSELTPNERVALLEQMQKQDGDRRRKSVFAAWGSVGIATLVLALLVFGAGAALTKTRSELAEIRLQQNHAEKELEKIRKETTDTQEKLTTVNAELKEKQEQLIAATEVLSSGGRKALETQLSADPNAEKLLPRAYFQIVDERDREWAKGIGSQLGKSGIIVPGVELVAKAAQLTNTQVRYYKKAEEAGANRIVALLKAAGVDAAPTYLNEENNSAVRPNHFEVWFVAGSRNLR
jgi:DNA repair exonuclease SbcCD ATPase subunit